MATERADRELEAPLGRDRIRRIYDRIGRRYDLLRFAEAEPKRVALALLAARPGERVLEVGVGTGAVLVTLAQAVIAGETGQRLKPRLGASPQSPPARAADREDTSRRERPVCGIDLSPRMLAVARERLTAAGLADAVELREGDATALPYPDATFDVLFSSYMLDLLPSADVDCALVEMRRVLRPGAAGARHALAGQWWRAGAALHTTL